MCNNWLAHSLSWKFDLSEEEEEIVLVAIPGLHEVGLGRWHRDHNQSVCAGCVRVHAGTSGRGIVWTLHCIGDGTAQLAEEHGARRAVDRWPPVAVCLFMLQKIGSWKGGWPCQKTLSSSLRWRACASDRARLRRTSHLWRWLNQFGTRRKTSSSSDLEEQGGGPHTMDP